MSSRDEARAVFLKSEDAWAKCFAAILAPVWNFDLLQQSADLNCSYAKALLSRWTNESVLAREAADAGEREGIFRLGEIALQKKDLVLAKEYFGRSAAMGFVWSMSEYAQLLEEHSPVRFFWLGKSARRGNCRTRFLLEAEKEVALFNKKKRHGKAVFEIGRAMRGFVDVGEREIFGTKTDYGKRVGFCIEAIYFFEATLKACRNAVDTWSKCAVRLGINHDVRIEIAEAIWAARNEADYKV